MLEETQMHYPSSVEIDRQPLRWQDVVAVARQRVPLSLSDAAWARIENAQAIVQQIVTSEQRAYGVNTGLGALCNQALHGEQLAQLSRNTLMSHACGVGTPLSDEQTRAIICCAIVNYSHGKSGIHQSVVEALLALLNHGVTPQVPSQGSVGYLTHMAHVGVALLGLGRGQLSRENRPRRSGAGGRRHSAATARGQRWPVPGQWYALHDRTELPGAGRRLATGALGRRIGCHEL